MLTSLHVRNFALIDHLVLPFGRGLNILTGETGAGKSIVIDALGVAIGDRASTDMIRTGTDKLLVEAVFTLGDSPATTRQRILDNSLENEDDPDLLILARELTKSGKSQCRINGRLVPTSTLRSIGQDLIDVHGQHEHQSLLLSETHIDLLDNWLGHDIITLRQSVEQNFRDLSNARKELETLTKDSRERLRNADLYRFQQNEIREAGLKLGELEALANERTRLTHAEKLLTIAEEAYDALSGAASDTINSALTSLSRAIPLDPEVSSPYEQIVESSAYLEEGIRLLRRYRESLDGEPGRLDEVNERLDLLNSLTRKYGPSIEDVIDYKAAIQSKLYALEDSDAKEDAIVAQIATIETELGNLTAALTEKRSAGAVHFSNAIEAELAGLAMSQTRFSALVSAAPLTASGADRVEFLISANPGEPLKPLAKTASGGEMSRLMLAIKSVLARSSYVPTMIFDEIDTGIGGRTGRVLADKLACLSEIAQILCITHLPQIASRPVSKHFLIEKSVSGGRTTISVEPLGDTEREVEIARMLGDQQSSTVLQHAREMLSAK